MGIFSFTGCRPHYGTRRFLFRITGLDGDFFPSFLRAVARITERDGGVRGGGVVVVRAIARRG